MQQLPTRPSFNHHYLRDTLFNGLWSFPTGLFDTIFAEIYRIPLGYGLCIKNGAAYPVKQQSIRDPIDVATPSFDDALYHFKNKLFMAVSTSLTSDNIGVELSGGLDSSAVAALARICRNDIEINAFHNGVPAIINTRLRKKLSQAEYNRYTDGLFDESKWSKKTSQYLNLRHHSITSGYHFHNILEKYTEILGCFSEVLFPLLNHRCYEIAEEIGVKTLLSGFGGDEVVSQHAKLYLNELKQNGQYWQYQLERIRQKKNIRDWLNILQRSSIKKSFWAPNTEHLPYLRTNELTQNVSNPQTVYSAEEALVEGHLSIHWQRRIETSCIIARYYGIDQQFPLANFELMRFFHQLPSKYKFHNGYGRYLFRQNLRGILPQNIIWRNCKKGATAPAAWSNLIENLPEIFLSRISPQHSGIIADYVDIPKLTLRLESGPILDPATLRLVVQVIMLAHLEKWLI